MVWGAFCDTERSGLHRMVRDEEATRNGYTANSYLEVFEEHIPTLYEPGLLFMQDNAPIHTANKIRVWLRDNDINVLEWPPYSPDLNPIEHLWYQLKQYVYLVDKDINNARGSYEDIQERLFLALERVWQMIPEELLHDLASSMERRISAVIEAEGWYTKY